MWRPSWRCACQEPLHIFPPSRRGPRARRTPAIHCAARRRSITPHAGDSLRRTPAIHYAARRRFITPHAASHAGDPTLRTPDRSRTGGLRAMPVRRGVRAARHRGNETVLLAPSAPKTGSHCNVAPFLALCVPKTGSHFFAIARDAERVRVARRTGRACASRAGQVAHRRSPSDAGPARYPAPRRGARARRAGQLRSSRASATAASLPLRAVPRRTGIQQKIRTARGSAGRSRTRGGCPGCRSEAWPRARHRDRRRSRCTSRDRCRSG